MVVDDPCPDCSGSGRSKAGRPVNARIPAGVTDGAKIRLHADVDAGGMTVDPQFFPAGDDFRGLRVHQTRLQGGDASSDSYCFVD